ncbi:exonuclease SbcCD subunit D [Palleronia sp. LCG004]|uniref:metallophosphoesterase family protein n=1 Tax=Palleronia sp. LCG004 TaxID=3079304 RepID=UPI0029424845|nr:metallophosphoesterase [Palleronia sp. LCG004]WOI55214.1 metallophosphoesterase [Palleronia sp. LCG004]
MPPFRFIHSSDLHLGRKFLAVPEPPDGNVRGRLMEARHAAIGRLAAAARDRGARHVLLAGDTFDSATPSAQVVRQALGAMGDAQDVEWWLLPGNHDNLRDAEPLWEGIVRDAPANVHAIREAAPVDLGGATLLPAPVTHRDPGRDLTEALVDMPSPDGMPRLGLAHGGVTDFSEGGAVVPSDRDRSARLDYLALGDWHGRLAIGPRVQFSGSPEQDRFRHDRRGCCLSVSLGGPGTEPAIEEVETGSFLWARSDLRLGEGEDAAAAFRAVLPGTGRRDTLLKLVATGWATLPQRAALEDAALAETPDFAFLDLDMAALGLLHDEADLDGIDRSGALRMAAEDLHAAARDPATAEADREIAGAALARLYGYMRAFDA